MNREALAIRNVSFAYCKKPVLRGFEATFCQGELTCIVGRNGCGKSTLVGLIAGLLKPASGTIMLCGKNSTSMKNKDRARLLSVLAQRSEIPAMTVSELVGCGRFPYAGMGALSANDRDVIASSIERMGLSKLSNSWLSELSGGQRQRANIAMVLAQDTPVVVMDEPTAYLDIQAAHDVMRVARDLAQDGKSVVVVAHDLDLALRYSDSIVAVDAQGTSTQGTVEQMLEWHCLQSIFGIEITPTHTDNGKGYLISPR